MVYTPVQALAVALLNADGASELVEAIRLADRTLQGLERMGFELLDVRHTPVEP